jgi:poly-gamma-glutamate synthesis protein (capsule biosynthesis protein)
MNRGDEEGNLLAVRNTKEYADFSIFTMHVHQNRFAFQGFNQDNYPTNFLIDFAHKLIDNGADMYVGHGNHAIQGVEIYKGRPIFYALGSLAQQQMMTEGSQEGSDEIPEGMTPMEADELDLERLRRAPSMIGLLATSTYQDGKLVEVRLHPMDLGTDKTRPWSKMGIAQTPSPQLAQEILAKVQLYSKPFGTQITIENGVGVIRVAPEATVPVGRELRSKFPAGYK